MAKVSPMARRVTRKDPDIIQREVLVEPTGGNQEREFDTRWQLS
jgi:hypothetical protein